MCECRATIVLQRAKHRIGVDLVARAIQIAAAVVTENVIAIRGDRTMIENIRL
jgi:CMP-2-keto-3-deoxyoctulosonic acid synthetase